MKNAGIDIGSRTIKVVVIENDKIILSKVITSTYNPAETCSELLKKITYDKITATGYGRHLIGKILNCSVISEIKAFGLGARLLYPGCKDILDIGGQDIKAISLDSSGRVNKFEMNDKCAAGTGKFLEVMAAALHLTLTEFSEKASKAEKPYEISNMCAVFAESEVISLITQGADRNEIALGIHHAVARRAATLMRKVNACGPAIFAGGAAYNKCLKQLIEKELNIKLHISENPQIIGAMGAALNNNNN